MNTNRQNYTKEQNELIAEYCAAYGLDPGQIIFFDGDPKPFFDREATAILLHRLTNVVGIEDEPVQSVFPDNISVRYKATFEDGSFATSTGMANFGEKRDGKPMSPDEVKSLATSRAARSALVNKGIDLVRLHEAAKGVLVRFAGPPRDERQRLLREVHALGYEASYIIASSYEAESGRQTFTDKAGWRRVLNSRYGVERSSDLTVEQLADLAAFLRSQVFAP